MRSVREAKTASALEELPKRVANDRDESTAEAQPGVLDDRFLMMWSSRRQARSSGAATSPSPAERNPVEAKGSR
jgi:hypothetical protein